MNSGFFWSLLVFIYRSIGYNVMGCFRLIERANLGTLSCVEHFSAAQAISIGLRLIVMFWWAFLLLNYEILDERSADSGNRVFLLSLFLYHCCLVWLKKILLRLSSNFVSFHYNSNIWRLEYWIHFTGFYWGRVLA